MGLKILHTADWHLDSPFSSLPVQAREKLRQAQRELPRLMGELCQREQCSLALLAGDIFDASPSRETVEALKVANAKGAVTIGLSGYADSLSPRRPPNITLPTTTPTSGTRILP